VKVGTLTVYCGPMKSGKSEALIRDAMQRRLDGQCVVAFHPRRDSGKGSNALTSRSGISLDDAIAVDGTSQVLERVPAHADAVVLDEPHMMVDGFVELCHDLQWRGVDVIVAGLDLDWRGQPMPPMGDLLCYATTVHHLAARCDGDGCDGAARYSHRLIDSKELIVSGDRGVYEVLCPNCWRQKTKQDKRGER